MASCWLSRILALQVATRRKTCVAQKSPKTYTMRNVAVTEIKKSRCSVTLKWSILRDTISIATPTAEWTTQQFREFLSFDHPYRSLIHDRDCIFSSAVDAGLKGFGVRVLRTPVQAPKANAFCERLVGTIRRERLDYLIPLNERHLKSIVKEFVGEWATAFRIRT
jgi:hypothetical protein